MSEVHGLIHGITCRVPGAGQADGNVGFGAPRDAADAWSMRKRWCHTVGGFPEALVTVRQVHGATVAVARHRDAGRGAQPGSEPLGIADALIAAESGPLLMTLHADCMPILLYAPDVRAIAVVHAGWRGTVAGVATAALRRMSQEFGVRPAATIAYLGPTNRACCFEVGDEVVHAWLERDPMDNAGAVTRSKGRAHFDVVAANRYLLLDAGLRRTNIDQSEVCTQCSAETWFSHRAQGAATGRFGAMIGLRELKAGR